MRFNNYLNEADRISPEQLNILINDIQNLVKPSFIKACKASIRLCVRNTKKSPFISVNEFGKILKTRTDRKPMDMFQDLHDSLDDAFQKKFGWKARSNVVFASPVSLGIYGKPYYFFPIGPYKYIWSEKIEDLYDALSDDLDYIEHRLGIDFGLGEHSRYTSIGELEKDEYDSIANKLMSFYTDKNLEEALTHNHEIMFNCKEYMLIDYSISPYDILEKL
jgi:hypothetical protein